LFSLLGDGVVALCSGLLAFWLRFHTSLHEVGVVSELTLRQYSGYVVFGSFSLLAMLAWHGIYHRSVLLRSRWIKARIVQGVAIWTLVFLAAVLLLQFEPAISRIYTALYGACTIVLLLAWRGLFEMFLQRPRVLETLQQRMVVVGWTDDAARFCRSFAGDPVSAVHVLGYVTTGDEISTVLKPDVPCLGDITKMESIMDEHRVEMVVTADLGTSREQVMELANLCEREMISFKMIPSCFRIFQSGLHLETLAGTPILGVDRLPLDNTFNVVLKRGLDIVGAIFGLVMSAPIVAVFGALVYLESPGAIFYRQLRTGVNGRAFDILKIRSMKLNAEANGKVGWSTKDDPRRLRVGAFMRKWNIDEVPQFWNVLKGDMSLVGPRPERPELIRGFKHEIPHYNARHNAKPGITGWAQIKGLRGDTDLTERIKCDLWYLENWNLLLDLQIMLMTFIKRDNAY
jgi:exopolysaccharide biosynthesis polyprenyl glycosylphosphotransferase